MCSECLTKNVSAPKSTAHDGTRRSARGCSRHASRCAAGRRGGARRRRRRVLGLVRRKLHPCHTYTTKAASANIPNARATDCFEACLFIAHLGATAYLLAHWSKLGSASNSHFISFNAVALLSFHYCVITPLLLMPASDRRTRAGFSLTALAWAYSLSLGLCSARSRCRSPRRRPAPARQA